MKAPADNRVLDPDDCDREPFLSVNRAIAEQIEKEKREAGEQLSFVYPSKRWEYPWALTRHPMPAGELVLDAGCGVSALPIYLAARGATVVAIDHEMRWLDREAIAARFHRVPVVPVEMDMTDLKFPDAHFDRVYCISVLEHIEQAQQPRAVREMARVLKPGGVMYLTVDYDERERRSEDDVVYDRLALQRWNVAPSGLEIEGTTDWCRDDWDEHHMRMRHFKLHTFAAMAVTLRKPPASGPESAEAIAARRARLERAFFAGPDVGSGDLDRARGAREVRVELGEDPSAIARELRRRAMRATFALPERAWGADPEALRAPIAAIDPDARALDLGTLRGDAHAWIRAITGLAHELLPAVPVIARASAREVLEGRLDGAALDGYAITPEAELPPAEQISMIRGIVAAVGGEREIESARTRGYAGAWFPA